MAVSWNPAEMFFTANLLTIAILTEATPLIQGMSFTHSGEGFKDDSQQQHTDNVTQERVLALKSPIISAD